MKYLLFAFSLLSGTIIYSQKKESIDTINIKSERKREKTENISTSGVKTGQSKSQVLKRERLILERKTKPANVKPKAEKTEGTK